MDRVERGIRLCMVEDLKRWVADRVKEDVTSALGVPVEKESSRLVCRKGNMYFEHKNVEVMRMIDLVFVKREIVYDLETMRELIRHLRSFCYIA